MTPTITIITGTGLTVPTIMMTVTIKNTRSIRNIKSTTSIIIITMMTEYLCLYEMTWIAPDKAYGTPDDYRRLVDECHKRGLAVILDIVFNQSDGLHPWYQMYRVAKNPFYNGTAPHAYSVLNDWNQDNPLVQQQWYDALAYWMMAYKVDGFRFDLVKGLGNNDSYKATYNPASNMWTGVTDAKTNAYNATRVARMKALHDAMRKVRHDEERMAYKQSKFGAKGVKGDLEMSMRRLGSVAAQMLMSPGAHMIWQFQEFGADQTTKDSNGGNNTSPKKVIWSYLDNEYRAGLAQSYRELCAIRTDNPALFRQGVKTTMMCAATNWANGRSIVLADGASELYCVVNPNLTGELSVSVPMTKAASSYKVLSASYGVKPVIGNKSISIPAGAYAVVGTTDLSAVDNIIIPVDAAKGLRDGRWDSRRGRL